MKFIVWLLAIFTAAVLFALAANYPGYVLIIYPPYRIEVSLTLFVLGMLSLLALKHYIFKFARSIIRLPQSLRTFRENRLLGKGRTAMMEAITAFFEGRYAEAEETAARAMKLGDTSSINPIIAARSAHELREFDKRDQYLASAKEKSTGDSTMRLIAQTEFLLEQKQPQQALNTLKELSTTGMHMHIGALQLELKAQQQARNWDGVLAVVAQLEQRSAIADIVSEQLRQHAWMEKLTAQAQDLNKLQSLWKSVPADYKLRPKISALATGHFIKLHDCVSAQKILSSSLNKHWDSDLVTLLGDCQDKNLEGQIEQAEKWLKQHSDDAGLLLALGKLCLNQGLWGKSQNYLDASISLAPGSAAYFALAHLSEKLGKTDDAERYKQLAMRFN